MGKVSTYGIIGTCIAAVSIILILIAMFSNGWYTATYESDFDEKVEFDFGLTEVDIIYTNPLGVSSSDTEDMENEPEDVGFLTNIFLIISLALILAYITLGLIGSLRKISGFIASIVGFTAAGCLIFVAIYYPIAFPDACEEAGLTDQFIDALSINWAYFLVLSAILPLIVGSIILLGVRTPLKYLLPLPDTRRKFLDEGDTRRRPSHLNEDRYDGRREIRQRQHPRDEHFHERDWRDYPPPRKDDDYPPPRGDHYDDRRSRDDLSHRRDDHYDDRHRRDHTSHRRENYDNRDRTDDLSILKKRLVRGEITKQEYEDLKQVIKE